MFNKQGNVRLEVLEKYGIDLEKENIFKLYKIKSASISDVELEVCIEQARRRWELSVNGSHEENAKRDSERLKKADKYEKILKNEKLRKQVWEYYSGEEKKEEKSGSTGTVGFAREYFSIIKTSKKIQKEDVEFFFRYYANERVNRKAIYEMLKKEFGVHMNGKEGEEKKRASEENEKGPLVQNLFKEETILTLSECMQDFEKARQLPEVCMQYPQLNQGLYEMVFQGKAAKIQTEQQLEELITEQKKKAFERKQEKGNAYVHVVNLFNKLYDLAKHADVRCNLEEFKLLLRYPKLTPYMFLFVEMKPKTIQEIAKIAQREYSFRNETDFILNYYNIMYDNFGISNNRIGAILKKAEKHTGKNKVLNWIAEKRGRGTKKELSIGAEILYRILYWPFFSMYFIFEIFKAIVQKLYILSIPVAIVVLILSNMYMPELLDCGNLLDLLKIFNKYEWWAFVTNNGNITFRPGLEFWLQTLVEIAAILIFTLLPAIVAFRYTTFIAGELNKYYDWIGYERTFRMQSRKLREKIVKEYLSYKDIFYRKNMSKMILSVVCLLATVFLIWKVPDGIRILSEKTGYFQEYDTYGESSYR